ncbi:MAG: helix-turn-helix transcriptional regulator [Solirubrobacteraceae bacterium]
MRGRVASELFVGREGELEALGADSGSVVVAGDAGVGKSRLVAELERRATAEGKLVLIGESFELTDGELPYAPIVTALRPMLYQDVASDIFSVGERQELSRLWPELGTGDGTGSEDGPSNQARIFALLLRLLVALARERPVVFIVEDLHWADRSTRDFLAFLVRATRGERILLVVTLRLVELHREHPVRAFVAELARVRDVRRVELSPFNRDELGLQVESILGERPPSDLVARLFERSEGNAFYTEELLAADDEGELPQSLRDLLLARFERLSKPTRQLLALIATAGRAVDDRLLAAVGTVPEDELAPALREALDEQVLVVRGDGSTYAFRHALVREAVYRDLLVGERAGLHAALARTLSERPELAASGIWVVGELAHHWYSAGELSLALEASVQASAESDRAFAFAETLRHCERALNIWYRVPDGAAVAGIDRVALLERTALASVWAEQPQRGAQLAAEAVAELDPESNPLRLAHLYVILGRCRWLSADTAGALEAYREAVRLVPEQPASPERALVLATEAQALMLTGQAPESLERCAQALELAETLDDRDVQAHVHNTLAGLGWKAGDAVEHAAIARRLASELGNLEEIGRSYVNGSEAYEYLGLTEDAIRLAQEGIEIASNWGITAYTVYLSASVALWRLRIGDPNTAARLWADAAPRGGTVAAAWYQVAGLLSTLRGDFARADGELEHAAELALGVGGPEWWPATTAAIAVLRLWQGRLDDAAHAAHEALDAVADSRFAPWLVDFSIVYPTAARVDADCAEDARARGDGAAAAEAAASAARAVARCDEMLAQIPEDRMAPRGLACRSLAVAEAARGEGRPEPDAWAAAVAQFRELGEPYLVAYAEFRQAEAAVAAGSRAGAEAVVPLQDAHAITVAMGEVPLRAQIEALARRSRIPLALDGQTPDGHDSALGITAREREVLVLLARGATNREIAEALVITEKTASVHVSHILAKLGARNRGEAAAIAHRLGLTADAGGA